MGAGENLEGVEEYLESLSDDVIRDMDYKITDSSTTQQVRDYFNSVFTIFDAKSNRAINQHIQEINASSAPEQEKQEKVQQASSALQDKKQRCLDAISETENTELDKRNQ